MEPTTTTTAEPKKKSKWKPIAIGGTIAAGLGIALYFLWPQLRKTIYVEKTSADNQPNTSDFVPTPKPSAPIVVSRNDNFPLRRGSRGTNVRALQNALIAKYGAAILPRYGADGDFGSETENALIAKGHSTEVGAALFASLTAGAGTSATDTGGFDATAIAKALINASNTYNYPAALEQLSKIKNTAQYSAVSEIFKQVDIRMVKYSLVTGMFRTFTTKRTELIAIFKAMGLKHEESSDKWSLAGFTIPSLITTRATNVWVHPQLAIQVPAYMVLGVEVQRRGRYCAFENCGKTLLVETAHVRYFN